MFQPQCEKWRKTCSIPPAETNPSQLFIGEILFTREWLDQAARESGFVKRESRKVSQDIESGKFAAANFRSYQRVLVQDSTVIKLPTALFPSFSGVSNGHSTVCNARIQAVYDLIGGRLRNGLLCEQCGGPSMHHQRLYFRMHVRRVPCLAARVNAVAGFEMFPRCSTTELREVEGGREGQHHEWGEFYESPGVNHGSVLKGTEVFGSRSETPFSQSFEHLLHEIQAMR